MRCSETLCEEVGRFSAVDGGADDIGDTGEAAKVLASTGAARLRTALRLSGAQALRRSLTLPVAAEAELRGVLYHQIEQLTPFQADEVCFGYRIESRDRRTGKMKVEMTVVPRKFVDAALAQAGRWGLQPDLVDVSVGVATAAPAINLIADERAPAADPWPRITGALAALALVLAIAAMLIPLQRAGARADALLAEAAKLRRASERVLALRHERDALERRVLFIGEKKTGNQPVLGALVELTRVIPKDTWLYQISLERPEVRIWGYSSSAASLIGKINDSPLFRNPRFRSPVTRSSSDSMERFNISFELVSPAQGKGR